MILSCIEHKINAATMPTFRYSKLHSTQFSFKKVIFEELVKYRISLRNFAAYDVNTSGHVYVVPNTVGGAFLK